MLNKNNSLVLNLGKMPQGQYHPSRHSGVALIQVLLISAIISLLAIRFTYTAREQIKTAEAFEQRIKATQLLKSTQSEMIFTLLTQDNFTQGNDLFPMSTPWNFYGKPFVLLQNENLSITVIMQDNAGLLPQQYIKWPLWKILFRHFNYSDEQIMKIQGEIEDWQDRDTDSWIVGDNEPTALTNGLSYRNFPIQLPQEINDLFIDHLEQLHIIKNVSMHYPTAGFNVLNAPDRLISLIFPQEEAEEIIKQRESNQLTQREITNFLGSNYDEEIYKFFPASQIKLTIQVQINEIQLQETIEIKLQPRKDEPLLIYARY